jgi:hypothetical protein
VGGHTLTFGIDGRYGMRGAGGPADQEIVRQEPGRRDPQTPTSKAS